MRYAIESQQTCAMHLHITHLHQHTQNRRQWENEILCSNVGTPISGHSFQVKKILKMEENSSRQSRI